MYELKNFQELMRSRMKGYSLSKISAQLIVPRSTLRDWCKVIDQVGLTLEGLKTMTPDQFLASVKQIRRPTQKCFEPDWNRILEDVSKAKHSLQLCYEQYLQECPKGSQHLGRSAFYEYYRKLTSAQPPERRRLYLHNSVAAGSVAMIDYSGDDIEYTDVDNNLKRTAQIFDGVLGHSGLIFCRGTVDQKRASWLSAIADMFVAFGGVTEEL